jgi:RNA polymerase sigma-70 factor (ECF subfamily)
LSVFQRELVELTPRLRRLARVLARNPTDADDLVQLTLQRAVARQAQRPSEGRLDAWLFRILKTAWTDEVLTRSRRGAPSDTAIPSLAPPGLAPGEPHIDTAEVERQIAGLPDDERLAVALVLIEGLSYREAADVLESPMGKVTGRLVRGRNAMLARLGLETTR